MKQNNVSVPESYPETPAAFQKKKQRISDKVWVSGSPGFFGSRIPPYI
jgi:hypothetical protein